MATMKTILKSAETFVVNNSPGILTGLGVAGTVSAAVLAAKGGFKASKWLEETDPNQMNDLKENVKQTWKFYIPAAAVGTVTIAAIIGANQIGSRRAAAFAAAFKLSEQLSEDYKKKVVETLGLQKEEKLRGDLAHDKMTKNPPPQGMIVVAGSNVLMYDELSGRYFEGQVENVKKAVNEINHRVLNYYCASLTEFYDKIGLTATAYSDSTGWNTDELLEVQFSATMLDDDRPAIMIGYNHEPIKGYDRCQ